MRTAVPRELRSWGDEIGILLRRWWWAAAIVVVVSWLPPVPAVQVAFNIGCLALVLLLGVWVTVTALRMPRRPEEKWKRDVSRNILASWPSVAMRVGLGAPGYGTRGMVVPAISTPVWQGWTCAVGVALPQGLGREHLQVQADLLAQAFGARRATVHGEHIGAMALRLEYVDALEFAFSLDLPAAWDGKTVLMGRDATGGPWSLRLGPHTLVAGASGSGKASLVWGLLLGLAEPIHTGLVEVWGIDRKGGMELALGRSLLTRLAADAERSVILLEDAVAAMQQPPVGALPSPGDVAIVAGYHIYDDDGGGTFRLEVPTGPYADRIDEGMVFDCVNSDTDTRIGVWRRIDQGPVRTARSAPRGR